MIRPAETSDVPRIRALMQSIAGFWDEGWRADVLERVLTARDAIVLVDEEGGVLDGFACAHDLGFRAYLSELVAAADRQGQGIGARLLAEVERRLADRGCGIVIADVWRDAEPFYRARGWAPPSVTFLRKRL